MLKDRIGGVLVSMLASSEIDCVLEPRSVKPKTINLVMLLLR